MKISGLIKRLRQAGENFLAALSFLTVLVPPRTGAANNFSSLLNWFGPAGLLAGIICAACSWSICLSLFSLARAPEVVASLCGGAAWIFCEIFLSRGLHWDGVADLVDGLGSGASGEEFWRIMKDSRLGTFGALATTLLVLGDSLFASVCFSRALANPGDFIEKLAPLALSSAWGRLAPIWLGAGRVAWRGSALGKLVCENPASGKPALLFAVCILALAYCAGTRAASLVALVCVQWLLIRGLGAFGASRGGLSGDFFGAAIEFSMTLFLFFSLF